MDEDYELRLKKELEALISSRQSLDAMLKNINQFSSLILSLDKRLSILEEKFENIVIDEKLQEIGMYG